MCGVGNQSLHWISPCSWRDPSGWRYMLIHPGVGMQGYSTILRDQDIFPSSSRLGRQGDLNRNSVHAGLEESYQSIWESGMITDSSLYRPIQALGYLALHQSSGVYRVKWGVQGVVDKTLLTTITRPEGYILLGETEIQPSLAPRMGFILS